MPQRGRGPLSWDTQGTREQGREESRGASGPRGGAQGGGAELPRRGGTYFSLRTRHPRLGRTSPGHPPPGPGASSSRSPQGRPLETCRDEPFPAPEPAPKHPDRTGLEPGSPTGLGPEPGPPGVSASGFGRASSALRERPVARCQLEGRGQNPSPESHPPRELSPTPQARGWGTETPRKGAPGP